VLTADQADLAAGYVELARSEAWGYFKRSAGRMDIDTCMSAAMFGLVNGCDTYPAYCQRNGFDPANEAGRTGYLRKRIRGSILDEARHNDHLARGARLKIKAVRAAEDDGIRGEAALAAATGLSIGQVRQLQADAIPHFSLDQHGEEVPEYSGPADPGAGTESQVAAKAVYLEPDEAGRQLEAAVCAVHRALLLAVSALDSGPQEAVRTAKMP